MGFQFEKSDQLESYNEGERKMKPHKTRQLTFALAIFGAALAATEAFAFIIVPIPAVPEPSSALLFAAGIAVAAISIRIIRRK